MAKVLISYFSATGNTKKMAELVGEGAKKAGGGHPQDHPGDVSGRVA